MPEGPASGFFSDTAIVRESGMSDGVLVVPVVGTNVLLTRDRSADGNAFQLLHGGQTDVVWALGQVLTITGSVLGNPPEFELDANDEWRLVVGSTDVPDGAAMTVSGGDPVEVTTNDREFTIVHTILPENVGQSINIGTQNAPNMNFFIYDIVLMPAGTGPVLGNQAAADALLALAHAAVEAVIEESLNADDEFPHGTTAANLHDDIDAALAALPGDVTVTRTGEFTLTAGNISGELTLTADATAFEATVTVTRTFTLPSTPVAGPPTHPYQDDADAAVEAARVALLDTAINVFLANFAVTNTTEYVQVLAEINTRLPATVTATGTLMRQDATLLADGHFTGEIALVADVNGAIANATVAVNLTIPRLDAPDPGPGWDDAQSAIYAWLAAGNYTTLTEITPAAVLSALQALAPAAYVTVAWQDNYDFEPATVFEPGHLEGTIVLSYTGPATVNNVTRVVEIELSQLDSYLVPAIARINAALTQMTADGGILDEDDFEDAVETAIGTVAGLTSVVDVIVIPPTAPTRNADRIITPGTEGSVVGTILLTYGNPITYTVNVDITLPALQNDANAPLTGLEHDSDVTQIIVLGATETLTVTTLPWYSDRFEHANANYTVEWSLAPQTATPVAVLVNQGNGLTQAVEGLYVGTTSVSAILLRNGTEVGTPITFTIVVDYEIPAESIAIVGPATRNVVVNATESLAVRIDGTGNTIMPHQAVEWELEDAPAGSTLTIIDNLNATFTAGATTGGPATVKVTLTSGAGLDLEVKGTPVVFTINVVDATPDDCPNCNNHPCQCAIALTHVGTATRTVPVSGTETLAVIPAAGSELGTHQSVIWSITEGGGTVGTTPGLSTVFTAGATAGDVTVRASLTSGTATNVIYYVEFTITVDADGYPTPSLGTLTVNGEDVLTTLLHGVPGTTTAVAIRAVAVQGATITSIAGIVVDAQEFDDYVDINFRASDEFKIIITVTNEAGDTADTEITIFRLLDDMDGCPCVSCNCNHPGVACQCEEDNTLLARINDRIECALALVRLGAPRGLGREDIISGDDALYYLNPSDFPEPWRTFIADLLHAITIRDGFDIPADLAAQHAVIQATSRLLQSYDVAKQYGQDVCDAQERLLELIDAAELLYTANATGASTALRELLDALRGAITGANTAVLSAVLNTVEGAEALLESAMAAVANYGADDCPITTGLEEAIDVARDILYRAGFDVDCDDFDPDDITDPLLRAVYDAMRAAERALYDIQTNPGNAGYLEAGEDALRDLRNANAAVNGGGDDDARFGGHIVGHVTGIGNGISMADVNAMRHFMSDPAVNDPNIPRRLFWLGAGDAWDNLGRTLAEIHAAD